MARDLFPAGFVSCWSELDEGLQEALIRSLEAALASPSIPKDIVTTLLNLAEFMEHDEKSLPLDSRGVHMSHRGLCIDIVLSIRKGLGSSWTLLRTVYVWLHAHDSALR